MKERQLQITKVANGYIVQVTERYQPRLMDDQEYQATVMARAMKNEFHKDPGMPDIQPEHTQSSDIEDGTYVFARLEEVIAFVKLAL